MIIETQIKEILLKEEYKEDYNLVKEENHLSFEEFVNSLIKEAIEKSWTMEDVMYFFNEEIQLMSGCVF